MATCLNCGAENPEGRRFCVRCDQPLPSGDTLRCPMCGGSNLPGAAVCEHCGARLRPVTSPEEVGEDILSPTVPRPDQPEPSPEPPAEPEMPTPMPPQDGWDTDAELRDAFRLPEEEIPDSEEADRGEAEEAPAWLSRLVEEESVGGLPEEEHEAPPLERPSLADEVPDWLQEREEALPEPMPPTEIDGLPPELAEGDEFPGGRITPSLEAEEPPSLLGISPEEMVPDWLKDEELPSPEISPAEEETLPTFDVGDWEEEITGEPEPPSWLQDEVPFTPATSLEREGVLDLPEEVEAAEAEPAAQEMAAVPIEQAEIPEWLRGMRPTDLEEGDREGEPRPSLPRAARTDLGELGELSFDAILGDSLREEALPEPAGALKDMRGTLRPEPIFVAPQPEEIVGGVVVTGEQSERIEAVLTVLAAEREGAVITGVGRRALPIERWLVALIMVATLVLPLVAGLHPLPSPQTRSPAVREAVEVIDALPEEAQALLAFEYEPDMAGELDVAAEAVLTHLVTRRAHLYAISTQPTGPAIAQRALENATADQEDYVYGERWVNLGYLPGGAIGVNDLRLGDFAGREVMLSRDYRGDPTRLTSSDLYDFDAVIVFAARPEDVRTWVEQIGGVTEAPILAVVSAGAAPIVYPYRQSGQLAGIVNGFGDALTYAASTQGLSPELEARWNAQALASLGAALAIIIGGVIYGLIALRQQWEQTR